MSVKLQTITELEDKCVDIRSNLLNFIYRIGMGHLGGELSIVEMTVALYYKYLNYDVMDPHKDVYKRQVCTLIHFRKPPLCRRTSRIEILCRHP